MLMSALSSAIMETYEVCNAVVEMRALSSAVRMIQRHHGNEDTIQCRHGSKGTIQRRSTHTGLTGDRLRELCCSCRPEANQLLAPVPPPGLVLALLSLLMQLLQALLPTSLFTTLPAVWALHPRTTRTGIRRRRRRMSLALGKRSL